MSNYIHIINRPHIYIDYESDTFGNIFLLGHQIKGKFNQDVLDSRLVGLAQSKNLKATDPVTCTIDLLEYAAQTNSIIVAYSEAEREIFKALSLLRKDIYRYSEIPYLNLRKAAKNWIRKFHMEEFNRLPPFIVNANNFQQRTLRNSLCSVMRLTNFHAPRDYAPGRTTQRINTVINALNRHQGDYKKLTRVQKAKGTRALKHNRFDVEALPVLFNAIKNESINIFSTSIKNCFD